MMQTSMFVGAMSYEFRMQIRRRALWITMTLLTCLLVALVSKNGEFTKSLTQLDRLPIMSVTAFWTGMINTLLPVGAGVLLADRFSRDRRTKVDELLVTAPGALSLRLLGKYFGSLLATLIPLFVFYGLGILVIVYLTHNIQAIPLGLVTFATMILPGMLFVSAFSLAVPAIMWVPLYQFGFVGYWFWGNLLGERNRIPTLSNTLLTPIGKYMEKGFFHDGRWSELNATPMDGVASILVLLGVAAGVLCVFYLFLKWQQARQ